MRLSIFILLLVIFISSKKEFQPTETIRANDSVANQTAEPLPPLTDPENAEFQIVGNVVLTSGNYTVIQEYTNDIAFKQPSTDANGNPSTYNYRDMVVHLINTNTKDTLSINKRFFRDDIDISEYNQLIMQSVFINQPYKGEILKIGISLCKPDTDYCYEYKIDIISKDQLTKERINEDDLE